MAPHWAEEEVGEGGDNAACLHEGLYAIATGERQLDSGAMAVKISAGN